jgi:hypothetical protein
MDFVDTFRKDILQKIFVDVKDLCIDVQIFL